MSESSSEFIPKNEVNNKPNVLWRGFSVDPDKLNIEMFNQPLTYGSVSKDDPAKIGDGNELGVYMSTNRRMVESSNYTHHSLSLSIEAPKYNDKGSITNKIYLPQCGVVVKVDTIGLEVHQPQITSYLKRVYNNGFQGDEYISDQISPKNYKVVKLFLSLSANDPNKLAIDILDNDPESLKKGIEKIKNEFELRKQKATKFANFLETIDPTSRLDDFLVQKKWKNYQELEK